MRGLGYPVYANTHTHTHTHMSVTHTHTKEVEADAEGEQDTERGFPRRIRKRATMRREEKIKK